MNISKEYTEYTLERLNIDIHVYLLCYVYSAVLTLDAGLLARSQYSEGPATSHLDTRFSWFPCA